mmetsp:Transcript_517/g.1868  ORF Transcript_517/g.1868 Transcript_517/m.1868 type:complete len:115 (-) Transcript_517:107-451(-)
MKLFRTLLLAATVACAVGFSTAPKKVVNVKSVLPKAAAAMAPAVIAAPALASEALVQGNEHVLNSASVMTALEVQFGAYLAVLLGTFVPVAFLIVLYIQSETRKAGAQFGDGED